MTPIDQTTLIAIAKKAGAKILDIYQNEDFEKTVDFKADDSPLTIADKAAHLIIEAELLKLSPNTPIMSEEGDVADFAVRKNWTEFWCVDPLDGTKEFIKRNGEFTVNIAFIKNGLPVQGVIYAPVLDTTYYGEEGKGAIKIVGDKEETISINRSTANRVAVRSKSHAAPEEEAVLEKYNCTDQISKGSSLKFCMVAEGKADVYYRHGPTMEWDTAAGQAVLQGAGGTVTNPDGTPFQYNKENLLNGSFLCLGF